jgi:MFS family permease
MMALDPVLHDGFGMFGVVSAYSLFVLAVVIITMGEMIVIPTSQAIAAGFARADMRGRYMAAYGLSASIPAAVGPAAAGVVLDRFNPNLLWYLGAMLCAISSAGFYALHVRLGGEPRFASSRAPVDAVPLAMEAEGG